MNGFRLSLLPLVAALAACSSDVDPQGRRAIDEAQAVYNQASSMESAQMAASVDLGAAKANLDEAQALLDADEDPRLVEHQAMLSSTHSQIAMEKGKTAQFEKSSQQLQTVKDAMNSMGLEKIDRGWRLVLDNLKYATGSAMLDMPGDQTLGMLADFLNRHGEHQVLVEGFTDNVGAEGFNQTLSEKRAEAVKRELVSMGVDESRLDHVGYGEAYPIASNDNPLGRQMNRRVEIILGTMDGATPSKLE